MILDNDTQVINHSLTEYYQQQEIHKAALCFQEIYLSYLCYEDKIDLFRLGYLRNIEFYFYPRQVNKSHFIPFDQSINNYKTDRDIIINISPTYIGFGYGEKYDANKVENIETLLRERLTMMRQDQFEIYSSDEYLTFNESKFRKQYERFLICST